MSMIGSSPSSSSNSSFCSSVSSTSALGMSVGESVFAGEKGTHYTDVQTKDRDGYLSFIDFFQNKLL